VQSTTGSRGVRISGSNDGYTMFRGSVKSTGYPLHSPVFHSLPFPGVTVCHHISTGLYVITFRHTILGGTPLDDGSARRRHLYLTKHNTQKRQTSLSPVWFEPVISTIKRPQTYALDGAATWIGQCYATRYTVCLKANKCIKIKDKRCRRTPGWNEVPFAIYYVLNNRHNEIN
jgi:hypothetical protein